MMDSLKNHISKISKGATPANVMNSREHESDVLFLKSGNVGEGSLVLKELSYISKKDHELLSRSSLKNNDVLLSIAGGIGKVAVIKNLNEQANTNQANAFIRTLPSLRPEYLSIAFQSSLLKEQFAKETVESAIQNLSMGQIQNVKLNVPSIERQDKVIESISKKFLLLNNFINSLTQKLHHIEEYKTALIHNAVTKGLDANGNSLLRYSDDRNISVASFKSYIALNTGGTWGSISENEKGIIALRSTEQTKDGKWNIDRPAILNPDGIDLSCILKKDDLLITKSSGSKSHIGKTTLVDEHIESLGAVYSNFMQRIRLNNRCYPKFAYYFLNSDFVKSQYKSQFTDTVGLGNLSAGLFNNLKVSDFSVENQKEISKYLDDRLSKLDVSVETINKKIALLREYKISLINEAVSGK
ncbi:restriction endonuclease subunit S [Vibrio parahaemolyticus]